MRIRSLCVLGLAGALLAACQAPSSAPSAGLRVLAAETFLADIARNVAGQRLIVESLLPPGVDPHEYEPAPQDGVRIAQAQVLIINGQGYEAWLQKWLEASQAGTRILEASAGVVPAAEGDPHLWMNPRHVIRYVENIRDGLSDVDPAGRSAYTANAEAYTRELGALDDWITDEVAKIPVEKRLLVTNHHALESFAEAYGFKIAGVVIPGVTSEAAPSAKEVAELIGMIQALDAPAIFLDVSENADLARQIASESGAEVISGLYVETLSEPGGPAATYVEMMKYDVRMIVEALR